MTPPELTRPLDAQGRMPRGAPRPLSRRQFLRAVGGMGLAAIAVNSVFHAAAPLLAAAPLTAEKRPNILFLMTDQQHWRMMSCLGNAWLKTPAMDRLAASGIRFDRAYACNPVCVPSRFSLQTGLMPSVVGVEANESLPRVDEAIPARSLGPLFKGAGYETAYGGKTHFPKGLDIRKLDYEIISPDQRQKLAEACVEFLKRPREKPFLLFASFINPHDICYMAINDYVRVQGKQVSPGIGSVTCENVLNQARTQADLDAFIEKNCPPLPENFEVPENEPAAIRESYLNLRPFRAYARDKWDEKQWRLHRWLYCRLTEMVDREIGQVLDALREAGLEENTLIVFTSDHGDMDASHRMEHKSVLYEESARIPFVMSWKGSIPAARVDDEHLVSNGLDLLPTLCDYAGIETPKGLHGRSLRRLAEGKSEAAWRDCVVAESLNGRMIRTRRYKYTLYDSGERREFLADLEKDPGEMRNLAGLKEYEGILKDHRRMLREWVEKTDDASAKRYLVSD